MLLPGTNDTLRIGEQRCGLLLLSGHEQPVCGTQLVVHDPRAEPAVAVLVASSQPELDSAAQQPAHDHAHERQNDQQPVAQVKSRIVHGAESRSCSSGHAIAAARAQVRGQRRPELVVDRAG
jgi:hypothetical protein